MDITETQWEIQEPFILMAIILNVMYVYMLAIISCLSNLLYNIVVSLVFIASY